jgi:ATP-dependent Clp protease ATP-binding subunit ClpA
MTSNAGTSNKSSSIGFNNDSNTAKDLHELDALKSFFRPEFLNRIDETIIFQSLSREVLKDIVEVMLKDVINTAKEKEIELTVTDAAKEYLVEVGFDEKYGARPLRRAIGKHIEDELAELFIKDMIQEGSKVSVDYINEKIVLSHT